MLSSSGGSLVFSTYMGGNAGEDGYGIATDSAGAVYVTGRTWSTDFPTQDPIQPSYKGGDSDAFVVIYAAGGARGFGTYLGGSARDDGYDVEVDEEGSIYLAGLTASTDFPLVDPIQSVYGGGGDDGFVARFFPNGSTVAYSTYLGGNLSDQARAIDLRGNADAYVAGSTGSANFPLVSPYQGALAGYNDIFVSRITDTTPVHEESRTITYDYDPLYRLTAADYDDGT